jgi:hypothetical protein
LGIHRYRTDNMGRSARGDPRCDDGSHSGASRIFRYIAAVQETVRTARERNTPYVVVINAAPVKREQKEAPAVALSRVEFDRLSIPVWSGQISQRAAFLGSLAAGASAGEPDGDPNCRMEIAGLWSAISRSVEAINSVRTGRVNLHGEAA